MSKATYGVVVNDHDYNDRFHSFLMPGARLGDDRLAFEETRHFDGSIRQRDCHKPMVQMFLPIKLIGATAKELRTRMATVRADMLAGGTLTWQEPDENGTEADAEVFILGRSDFPEPAQNWVYRHLHIVVLELQPWRFPRTT